jgi:hypothetical protein
MSHVESRVFAFSQVYLNSDVAKGRSDIFPIACDLTDSNLIIHKGESCIFRAIGMDVSALRYSFRCACTSSKQCLGDGQLRTKPLDSFKHTQVALFDRILSAQGNASVACAALVSKLGHFHKGQEWWTLGRIVKLNKRLHAMLFFQRTCEMRRYMELFFGAQQSCWMLLETLRDALVTEVGGEKRVIAPRFLQVFGECSEMLSLAFEFVKELSKRAAESLFSVFAKGHYGSLATVLYATCATIFHTFHDCRLHLLEIHQWFSVLHDMIGTRKSNSWKPLTGVPPISPWTSFDNSVLVKQVMGKRVISLNELDAPVDAFESTGDVRAAANDTDDFRELDIGFESVSASTGKKKKKKKLDNESSNVVSAGLSQSMFSVPSESVSSITAVDPKASVLGKRVLVANDDFLALLAGKKKK